MVGPLISEGMLDRAVENASYNIGTLLGYADAGIPIIGCEPSCTSAITDDYVELIGTSDAKRVAEVTYSFEEFFAQLAKKDELPLEFSAEPRDILPARTLPSARTRRYSTDCPDAKSTCTTQRLSDRFELLWYGWSVWV